MKKKIVSVFCVLGMVASLMACGQTKDVRGEVKTAEETKVEEAVSEEVKAEEQTTVEAVSEVESEVATETEDEVNDDEISLGKHTGNVYENEFLGIGCELDSSWTCLSDEQILERNQLTADALDGKLKDVFTSANLVIDMVALNENQVDSVNVNIEKLTSIYQFIDEKAYVELSISQSTAALEQMGFENLKTEQITMPFCGEERHGIRITGEFSGVKIFETLVCIKRGSYMSCVTASTWGEDGTTDILDKFYSLN